MEFLKATVFGITQGITEFLPISSSGHLLILHKYIPIQEGRELAFDVFLHLATLVAVCLYFRRDISIILKDWFLSLKGGDDASKGRLGWLIIAGTIPAALAGYFFEDRIESLARGNMALLVVAFMLVFVGILFILVEKIAEQKKDLGNLDLKSSVLIGLAQAAALIPGTSRSGATIIAGMKLGLKRGEAVRFSFLLSIPIILGANILKVPALFSENLNINEWILLVFTFVFAFASGILAIHFLLFFANKYRLNAFAYYRFILATVLIFLFFWL